MKLFGRAGKQGGNALRDELATMRRRARELGDALDAPERMVEQELVRRRTEIRERASLAAVGGPRLLSERLTIDGTPGLRARIQRRRVGDAIERPFAPSVGVTRCESTAPDVRELWERLIAAESNRDDNVLRGVPSAILDIPHAVVTMAAGALRVSMQASPLGPESAEVLAIPRFTFALPARKQRNFGHWLVDCVPQVDTLSSVVPDATFLVPPIQKPFQEWALSLAGAAAGRVVAWDGTPAGARRLLVFENDGRSGGGRPLAALDRFRRRLLAESAQPGVASRRLYITRRDARKRRIWIHNQDAIEDLFRSRGFEVLSMADCPLDEQARIFRDARVVAGISGAGLTDLIFSQPGTHAIVLLSDSLIRWYADRRGARSLWTDGTRGGRGRFAELGDSPRFYAHLAAAFEQRCHSFVGGDEMPIDHLARFLDEVLAEVDGA